MDIAPFNGDKKVGTSFLTPYEQKLRNALASHVPSFIQTYHLTLLTLLWSGAIIGFGYLASIRIDWLWMTSLMIVFQYVSDLLDGEIGRRRNTGLIKWGFFMDHFLDYIFLCALIIGYSFIFPDSPLLLLCLLSVFGAFMVNSFLEFSATNKFRITFMNIGPTEARIGFILLNSIIVISGPENSSMFLPYLLGASVFGLIFMVWKTQKELWKADMDLRGR
jgi:phosphatidylglycerophosphate synthase